MSAAQPDTSGMDWTQMLEDCRLLIVQHMDSITRAAWRTACTRNRQDVNAFTSALIWRGDNLSRVPLPVTSPVGIFRPEQLAALAAVLPRLNRYSMHARQLSLQGIPPTLRFLELSGTLSLCNLQPLQHCTALEHLALECYFKSHLVQEELQAVNLLPTMAALNGSLRRLKLHVTGHDNGTRLDMAAAVLCILQPLTGLQELQFRMHFPDERSWHTFASFIRQLRRLRTLDLSNMCMNRNASTAIVQAIGFLPATLTSLDLHGGIDTDTDAAALAAALLAHSPTLNIVRLSTICLGPEGMAALVPSMYRCSSITSMDLSDCTIRNGGAALATALAGCASCLTSLRLSVDDMGDADAEALAPVLGSMTSLVSFNCSQNNFGPTGAAALAAALSAIAPSLTSLNLGYNPLGDSGGVSLAPVLHRMTALQYLRCHLCKMGPSAAIALASALPAMTHLKHLGFDLNHFGLEGLRALSQGLQALSGRQVWHIRCFPTLVDSTAVDRLAEAELRSVTDGLSCISNMMLCVDPSYPCVWAQDQVTAQPRHELEVTGLMVDFGVDV